jgi:hypothetical protein
LRRGPVNWTTLVKTEIEETYAAAQGLMKLVEPGDLGWKPPSGSNWMTVAQLLEHMPTACGFCCRGFVTGDWGMPEGVSYEEVPKEEMLPAAEKMPSAESVEQALEKLAADKQVALAMVEEAGEEALATRLLPAPWNPSSERLLGYHLLNMVGHLQGHKAQLFYYLKLLGRPVHTGHLWGM